MKIKELRIGDIVTVKGHDFPMEVVGPAIRMYSCGRALSAMRVTCGRRLQMN